MRGILKKMSNKEIEIYVSSDGFLQFRRGDKQQNEVILSIAKEMCDIDEAEEEYIDSFFRGGEEIKILVGDRMYCG